MPQFLGMVNQDLKLEDQIPKIARIDLKSRSQISVPNPPSTILFQIATS